MEWNDPADIALVSRTFDRWAAAVIAKDRGTVETFHDDGFRVRLGKGLLNKSQHIDVELAVAVREMSIIEIELTRRMGDLLLVWSKHLIMADHVPELPELGLKGDWGNQEAARVGFVQLEFTVWRREGDRLKCVAFEARGTAPA
ncbi:MAG TPA: hypothetical protein VMT29_00730 [Steroidobacteraceae bacterium]|nr:hypothetical protein [Steroidobacteraceae bacterium]